MDVKDALDGIREWYGDDDFSIRRVTDSPDIKASADDFDQSPNFISVIGWQEVSFEDSHYGKVYFEYEPGLFIETSFLM